MIHLSNNIEIFSDQKNSKIHILQRGTGIEKVIECDKKAFSFLEYLKSKDGYLDKKDEKKYSNYTNFLLSEGVLTREKLLDMNHPYRTQLQSFEEWGLDPFISQDKLKKSKVAIIGCGGTGGWLAMELAGMGTGNLLLVDPDKVETSNLTRQPFKSSQVGELKTHALRSNIAENYPEIKVNTSNDFVRESTDLSILLSSYEYICIAADYPSISEMAQIVGKWCLDNNKIHFVCGGYSGHNSALGLTIIPKVTRCWECYLKWYKRQISVKTKEAPFLKGPKRTSGIFPIVLMAASMNAIDVLRVIVGLPPVLINSRLDLNPMKLQFKKTSFESDKNCIYCKDISCQQ